jgi:hypothetical protein
MSSLVTEELTLQTERFEETGQVLDETRIIIYITIHGI